MEKFINYISSFKFYGPFIYILCAYVLYFIFTCITNKLIIKTKTKHNKKKDTVLRLLNSVFKYTLIIIIIMMTLELYGVKSLKGNHELYATIGVDVFRKHLEATGSYNSALRNSLWTKGKLTPLQIEKIKALPEDMVIEIGGKKVMLSHYMKDYNTGKEKNVPENISDVFQGHVHFETKKDRINTLQGAGIGGKRGEASYVVLTEKPFGGYDIEVRHVKYDYMSTHYDIIESDLSRADMEKIDDWIGGRSR